MFKRIYVPVKSGVVVAQARAKVVSKNQHFNRMLQAWFRQEQAPVLYALEKLARFTGRECHNMKTISLYFSLVLGLAAQTTTIPILTPSGLDPTGTNSNNTAMSAALAAVQF